MRILHHLHAISAARMAANKWRFAATSALFAACAAAELLGQVRLVDQQGNHLLPTQSSTGFLQVHDGQRWGFVEASESLRELPSGGIVVELDSPAGVFGPSPSHSLFGRKDGLRLKHACFADVDADINLMAGIGT